MDVVLIVDRSQVVRAVVERHLERFDCVVVAATNADEALAAIREHQPALILAEAGAHAAAVRAGDAAYFDAPVVVLTTDHPASAEVHGHPRIVARLRKPFDRASFDRAIGTVLGPPRARAASASRRAQGASL